MNSLPLDTSSFNFKPGIILILSIFHDFKTEKPYLYLGEFEEMYNICANQTCSKNIIKTFIFSLFH